MLFKENRLRKKTDFQRVFKLGKGFKNSFLYIKFVRNDMDLSRIGFVVSKEISNKSSQRNKIKRMLRESSRKNFNFLAKGVDLVFVVLPEIKKDIKSFEGLKTNDFDAIIPTIFKKIKN
ncbi:MAG TPA: ribonuclease P protein component [Candidatus Pacearchaeota archaeon]|nr:ribonuclease P protein component [Candidatus Pacearchaeota archaeon]HPM08302.1 ribonuclease P protein component [Candidatus Pacearchaeota archaeon]HQI74565.1 ribonuclease P protein component [Candidatus Pacearchaeota archaeon]